ICRKSSLIFARWSRATGNSSATEATHECCSTHPSGITLPESALGPEKLVADHRSQAHRLAVRDLAQRLFLPRRHCRAADTVGVVEPADRFSDRGFLQQDVLAAWHRH